MEHDDVIGSEAGREGKRTGLLSRLVAGMGKSAPGGVWKRAVALALKWLAEHQMPDGGWSFNHVLCPACGGQCRNPGELAEARAIASTAGGT